MMIHRLPSACLPSFGGRARNFEFLKAKLPKTMIRFHSEGPISSTAAEDESQSAVLKTSQDSGVLTLTLNRPKQRNALNRNLLESLIHELEDTCQSSVASSSNGIRAVVLQAEGGSVFSSGHDLKELMTLDETGQGEIFDLCSHLMQLLSEIPQPTIGAINGLATAAGCQLAASCDLVVGNPMSGFSTPGASTIGLFCHTPAVPLVRSIGVKKAMDMLLTGRTITAPEALEYGLITHIAANPQREAAKIAHQIAKQSGCAMQMGKRTLYAQAAAPNLKDAYQIANQAMVENMKTNDTQAGIDAFLNKKDAPTWKHT